MLRHIVAFITGVLEFRSGFTTGYTDLDLMDSYDKGRDLAHRLTFRYFDY